MDSSVASSNLLEYNPFPRNSVNLVVGPTHIGKTYFVTKLLNNYKTYFSGPVGRILIVLCNERVQPLNFDPNQLLDVSVEHILLSEFVPDNLQEHDLVVIDDLQTVTETIRLTISVCAHHYNLVSLFVVTHNLLGNPNFELVNYCHRLFLFMSASTNARQVNYIINHFYHDSDIKNYLKTVLGFCQSEKEVLALELNPLASQTKTSPQVVLAFSHLTLLVDKGYFLLYPYPHWGKDYTANFTAKTLTVVKPKMSESFSYEDVSAFPIPTLVAVPIESVMKVKAAAAAAHGEKKKVKCSEEEQWEATNEEILEQIESYFPPNKWQRIKNLAKEILRNPNFCVKTDGKIFHIRNKARTAVSLIDFLAVATRRAGPMERERDPIWKMYALHVDTLLRNNAPKDLFKNKFLLPARYQ